MRITHDKSVQIGRQEWLLATAFGIILALGGVSAFRWSEPKKNFPQGSKRATSPLSLPAEMIEAGKRVYFTKCVWCHGVDGAGDGPGADRLWPRPRNFNQGTFKIRHTASGEFPSVRCQKAGSRTERPL